MEMHRLPVAGEEEFDFVTIKVKRGEPVFPLRGQDIAAHDTVLVWIDFAENAGASREKLLDAKRIAGEFNRWPNKKTPD